MRSSMFYLWLVSGILGYAQKIPFISKIITLLSLYYGRTTIWKVLIKLRKAFVFINATIGVWMVYKSVGFGVDNILAGIAGMGHTYVEIISNFSKRLFNWLFELFDYKVVPNIPNNKPSTSWPEYKSLPKSELPPIKKDGWVDEFLNKKSNIEEWFKLRDSYKNVTINTNPWYTDLSTWLWVAGIATSIGLCYFGYQFMTNPDFIQDSYWLGFLSYFKSNPGGGGIGPDINVSGETIAEASGSQSGYVGDFFTRSSRSIFRGLNPYNWFKPAADSQVMENTFMLNQASTTVYDNRFYPYTEYNPFAPLHKRLKMLIIVESAAEYNARIAIKKEILGKMMPDIVMGSALNVPDPSLLNSNWASRTNSPILKELRNLPFGEATFNSAEGISSTIASGIGSSIASASGIPVETFDQVINKLESIKASTKAAGSVYKSPSIINTTLPHWAEHSVEQGALDDWHLENRLHAIRNIKSTAVSEVSTPIQLSNKFSVLNEENI